MNFEAKSWPETFTMESGPFGRCPQCNQGKLALDKAALKQRESKDSEDSHHIDAWEPDNEQGYFTAIFLCTEPNCSSPVMACGTYDVSRGKYDDPDTEQIFGPFYITNYRPDFFTPELPILPLPEECTPEISAALHQAWRIFWSDPGACANRIRASIELLLDHASIPQKKLHHRIEDYQTREPELGHLLMAIKWLGNAGSHSGAELSRSDILEAIPLLEEVLVEVFGKRRAKLRQRGAAMIQRHTSKKHDTAPINGTTSDGG
ncbi:DUF4145 domain-containing protein [Myxococcus xanthus]|uniref:DUF4145 domain-containing protein n=1 Tax=Myxococcus xanthus TaxID=34 RepID=UPI00112EC90A|nr:DUF4145 domain-containing protein [Myxococcus xanthus]